VTKQRPAEAPEASPPADADDARARRLAHIFRGWLNSGHVHPLLHLMHQYRERESR